MCRARRLVVCARRPARTAAPASFVKQVIGAAQPMSMEGTRIVARDSRGTMHAYADAATGEAQIFPDFASTGAAAQPATLENAASAVFSRGDVIPKDATTARITDVIPVMSAQASHGSDGSSQALSAPQRLFTYYTVTRYAPSCAAGKLPAPRAKSHRRPRRRNWLRRSTRS